MLRSIRLFRWLLAMLLASLLLACGGAVEREDSAPRALVAARAGACGPAVFPLCSIGEMAIGCTLEASPFGCGSVRGTLELTDGMQRVWCCP